MKITAGHCSQNWGWTEDKKADGYGSIATWFAKRRILTVEDYEKVSAIDVACEFRRLSILTDSVPSIAYTR